MKSRLAILAFVLAIIPYVAVFLSFLSNFLPFADGFLSHLFVYMLLYPLFVLSSLILGIVSLKIIKKHQLSGKGYAMTAIILGLVGILLLLVLFFVFNPLGY